jgi:hypothetical protein
MVSFPPLLAQTHVRQPAVARTLQRPLYDYEMGEDAALQFKSWEAARTTSAASLYFGDFSKKSQETDNTPNHLRTGAGGSPMIIQPGLHTKRFSRHGACFAAATPILISCC